jgi:hypothetical protein
LTNNAFAAALVIAAIPAGAASAIVGVWAYRAIVAWMVAG